MSAGATRILDVGAGPGKFCIIGALTTAAHFVGIEQRRNLVEEARRVSAQLGADQASFVHSNLVEFDCTPFDGFYFYNPFYEQLDDDAFFPIDRTLARSEALFNTYVASTTAALIRAPIGTLVATFHGFGGPMPPQYRVVHEERTYGADLVLWRRAGNRIARIQRRTV